MHINCSNLFIACTISPVNQVKWCIWVFFQTLCRRMPCYMHECLSVSLPLLISCKNTSEFCVQILHWLAISFSSTCKYLNKRWKYLLRNASLMLYTLLHPFLLCNCNNCRSIFYLLKHKNLFFFFLLNVFESRTESLKVKQTTILLWESVLEIMGSE